MMITEADSLLRFKPDAGVIKSRFDSNGQ